MIISFFRIIDRGLAGEAGLSNARAVTRPTRVVAILALTFVSTLLCACGSSRLLPDIPDGVSLAGAWRLNRAVSDDPQALIQQLEQKAARRMRPPAGEFPFAPRDGALLTRRYGQALGAGLGGDGLVIEQGRGRFAITRNGSRRSYTPGGHSVVSVADGVADQHSGWKGREYVIEVRPQVGPRVLERFGLSADGQLIETVIVAERGFPTLEFRRVYDVGPAPERAMPTSN